MTKTVNMENILSSDYLKRIMLIAEKKNQKLILVGDKNTYRKFMVSDARVRKTAIELVSRGTVELHLH
ncbi:hypothetical protein ACS7VB_002564 [Enterococcus faecalis]